MGFVLGELIKSSFRFTAKIEWNVLAVLKFSFLMNLISDIMCLLSVDWRLSAGRRGQDRQNQEGGPLVHSGWTELGDVS